MRIDEVVISMDAEDVRGRNPLQKVTFEVWGEGIDALSVANLLKAAPAAMRLLKSQLREHRAVGDYDADACPLSTGKPRFGGSGNLVCCCGAEKHNAPIIAVLRAAGVLP